MIPIRFNISSDQLWDIGQRGAKTLLPFLSFYKPFSQPIALATGSLRVVSTTADLVGSLRKGKYDDLPTQLLQTVSSVSAIAGTIFKHPVGVVISSATDLIVEAHNLKKHLTKGDYQKGLESSLNIASQAVYLACMLQGGAELSIASLAFEIVLGVYHARHEIGQGHYIEAAGHVAMTLIKTSQICDEIKTLRAQWALPLYHGEEITAILEPADYPLKEGESRIFLIRHAETEWNASGSPQGWNDIPLNEEGLKQAAFIGEAFARLPIGQIYASSLTRAKKTSEAIGVHHPEATIAFDPALRFYDPNKKKPIDDETDAETQARITREIIEAATAYIRALCAKSQGQNIVIVTHGKVIKSVLWALSQGAIELSQIKIGNGAMVRLIGTENGLSLED